VYGYLVGYYEKPVKPYPFPMMNRIVVYRNRRAHPQNPRANYELLPVFDVQDPEANDATLALFSFIMGNTQSLYRGQPVYVRWPGRSSRVPEHSLSTKTLSGIPELSLSESDFNR
jgi:hypothetical protein